METIKQENTRLRKRLVRMTDLLQRARFGAQHDPLTGLANRSLLLDRLKQDVSLAGRLGHELAVLMIDLDGFKLINDHFGHHMGDQVLRLVATRISSCLRTSDTAARLGGDEFVVLLPEIQGIQAALLVMEKIGRELALPYSVEKETVYLSASIGMTSCRGSTASAAEMLLQADRSMYVAKLKHYGEVGIRTMMVESEAQRMDDCNLLIQKKRVTNPFLENSELAESIWLQEGGSASDSLEEPDLTVEVTMPNTRHILSGMHKQAASWHEAAAQNHREAAALFEAAMPVEAGKKSDLALLGSEQAHNASLATRLERTLAPPDVAPEVTSGQEDTE